ncbi:hypothetical protein CWI36_0038p0010 [Hamiltosporidium magnivora]|uniref:Uncharacterized protein n=1 Tax=Hamiltosporidium magnivora TaxID=148818 RepID=A0A4Q9LP91_9MICR|nr:hypothetical protein CWI36_0038p0010 [Hamiltosporidium magnivora]
MNWQNKSNAYLIDVSTSTIDCGLRDRYTNMRGESAYLSVTAAHSRNVLVIAAKKQNSMIYHKIPERAVKGKDFKLFIKEINEMESM